MAVKTPRQLRDAAYTAKYRKKLRDELFAAYGDKCACCGETRREFLTIDHTFGGGNGQRTLLYGHHRGSPRNFYSWLRVRGFPQEAYRCLCFNCNCGREKDGGMCPHERERIIADELTIECMREGAL